MYIFNYPKGSMILKIKKIKKNIPSQCFDVIQSDVAYILKCIRIKIPCSTGLSINRVNKTNGGGLGKNTRFA